MQQFFVSIRPYNNIASRFFIQTKIFSRAVTVNFEFSGQVLQRILQPWFKKNDAKNDQCWWHKYLPMSISLCLTKLLVSIAVWEYWSASFGGLNDHYVGSLDTLFLEFSKLAELWLIQSCIMGRFICCTWSALIVLYYIKISLLNNKYREQTILILNFWKWEF